MNDRYEEELVRTLSGAADAAPEPPGDLLGAIGARRARRTRRRVQSVLAVAAVVAVVGGGTAVARGVFSHRGGEGPILADATATAVMTTPAPSPQRPTQAGKAPRIRPAAEVWPAAVSTIPAKAPDGWRYRPITALSATELLLAAESSFERSGRLEVYDTARGSRTVLAEMPAPEGVKGYFAQSVDVGAEYVAWYGTTPDGGDRWADFWVVPRTGGTARQVGVVTGEQAEVEALGTTADSVVWSVSGGGVYRMPLGGGTPERIEGTDGLHLLSWPWATDVGERDWEKPQTRLVDLETMQTTEVSVPEGMKAFGCGLEWCFGAGESEENRIVAGRTDGSQRRTVPGLHAMGRDFVLARDFGMFSVSGVVGRDERGEEIEDHSVPVAAVYDPVTGTLAGVGRSDGRGGGSYGRGTSSSPSSIVYWDEDLRNVERCRMVEAEKIPRPSGFPSPTGKTRHCETIPEGGGKELTVVNLLAVPRTE
ncbi:hypothetical protein [Planomonospora venezuelensis]|uniref:Uncharacterized protein n=1 Tax=Planomonospora venezuelensis TaxID=1999 RepID=A0A841CY85_PLAVE|nr:hypothetical protein [Planomonospora venezuelensis]MBB5960947.1 hypothetical protein [Planomonospora venezuelensis]GIN01181.1 hypothetical protein Pve01_28390 [Planomonospora venezuelensis]